MKIENLIMGLIIFSLFMVVGVMLIGELNSKYSTIGGSNISTSEFNSSYNKINEMYNLTADMKNKTYGASITETNFVDSSYQGAYSATRLTGAAVGAIGAIINDVSTTLGLPSFFVTFAMIALTVSIVFALIYLILRFK